MSVLRIGGVIAAVAFVVGCNHNAPTVREIPGYPGYRLQQSVALHSAGAPDARLELLEDSRITPTLRPLFQRGLPDDACSQPTSVVVRAFCDTLRRQPLRSAVLRFAATSGNDLDTTSLERPIADLMVVVADPSVNRRIYGVSVDLTAEAGTYSGPYVRLLDQRSRRFDWIRAKDSTTGEVDEIHLPTTPKTAWQVTPNASGESEIFVVSCRPFTDAKGRPGVGFEVIYDRYAASGDEWVRHRRSERGFWENDGAFPRRSRFP